MSLDQIIADRKQMRVSRIMNLNEWASRSKKPLGKASIFLFGSYARGDFNVWSDVDIIVVADIFKEVRFIDRVSMLPELELSSDVVCWTVEEFKEKIKSPSWKRALDIRVVIADDYDLDRILA